MNKLDKEQDRKFGNIYLCIDQEEQEAILASSDTPINNDFHVPGYLSTNSQAVLHFVFFKGK